MNLPNTANAAALEAEEDTHTAAESKGTFSGKPTLPEGIARAVGDKSVTDKQLAAAVTGLREEFDAPNYCESYGFRDEAVTRVRFMWAALSEDWEERCHILGFDPEAVSK